MKQNHCMLFCDYLESLSLPLSQYMSETTQSQPRTGGHDNDLDLAHQIRFEQHHDCRKTLTVERSKATFDVGALCEFLDGGPQTHEARIQAMKLLETDPVFDRRFDGDCTRQEIRKKTLLRIRKCFRLFVNTGGNPNLRSALIQVLALHDPSYWTRNGVHFGLFGGAVTGQGDDEQQNEWMPKIMSFSIFGCFGMTELGHGSFVRGVETTATFISGTGEQNAEWEINTPTLTATKWWIGGAAHTATHCAVFARTVIFGREYDVHAFIVPLRDISSHRLLPGVIVGDLGKKMGRDGIDNGFIQFHNVRIPRRNMLMKYAYVETDGSYHQFSRGSQQMAYGALVAGRAMMIKDSADWMKRALVIAVRYAAIRRQGGNMTNDQCRHRHDQLKSTDISRATAPEMSNQSASQAGWLTIESAGSAISEVARKSATEKLSQDIGCRHSPSIQRSRTTRHEVNSKSSMSPPDRAQVTSFQSSVPREVQILDYKTHQYRLMPLIAKSYAFHSTATHMQAMSERVSDEIGGGDLSNLPDMHATSAGLKAFCTWATHKAIDICRHSTGGHGYSGYTGLSTMFNDFAVQCTWEGDNVVLALQTARYLVRCCANAQDGQKLRGSVSYLSDSTWQGVRCHVAQVEDWLDWKFQRRALRWLAHALVESGTHTLQISHKTGNAPRNAWNDNAIQLFEASKVHVHWTIAMLLNDDVERASHQKYQLANIRPVLELLRNLYVLHFIQSQLGNFMRLGYLLPHQSNGVVHLVQQLCVQVRAVAVPLVDAFGLSDFLVGSPLGRYDGDVYTSYMKTILQTRNCFEGGKTYSESAIRPMLQGEDLSLAAQERKSIKHIAT